MRKYLGLIWGLCHWIWSEGTKFWDHGLSDDLIHLQRSGKFRLKLWSHCKVENILKGSLDSIQTPSPSEKIQIMARKVCLMCKGKTLQDIVNKLLRTKSLLTSPSNALPYYCLNKLSRLWFVFLLKVMGWNPGYLFKSFLL